MLVDFQTIDINDKPVLVLKTPSGKVLQTLGFAHELECQFRFNEVSQISFQVPAYVNGEQTPNYDKIVGEMIIDMVGWGQFILQNPKTENDGIKEIKTCTAYSMEYEMSHKQFPLEEGTYNFWNPASPEGTMLWLICECCPGWSVGSVDSSLIGKYRTFDSVQDNAYNIMMNTLQKPYKCVFYFDTYKKKIHAVDATGDSVMSPVFLSLQNLVKKIDIDERSENLVTVLDVNGSDDVDIRSVNPLGTNKIYNLDYFMNTTHFDQDLIDGWNTWKELFEERRQEYFALSVRRAMKTAEILTLQARKTDEEGVLTTYENEQAVNIQAATAGDSTGTIARKLEELKQSVDEQNAIVEATQEEIDVLQSENDSIVDALQVIIDEVSFENNFTEEQIEQLQPYFIEDSIAESTFAMVDNLAFADTSTTVTDKDITVRIEDCDLMKIAPRGIIDEQIYSFTKGNLSLTYVTDTSTYLISAEVNRGSAERNGTKTVVTAAVGSGSITNQSTGNNVPFTKGTFTLVGTHNYMSDDTLPDQDTPNVIYTGKSLVCGTTDADMYITSEITMMEQYAVEWDLFEYGEEQLRKLAYPTYTFKIDTANFLALADFVSFTTHLTLGRRDYLDIGDKVLRPILTGVDVSFDDLSSLTLMFSDTYHGANNAFDLVDLLEQSVSMGHKLDVSKFSYNDYVNSGAKTAVRDFLKSSLDASKNSVINASNQAIEINESGLHLRKPDGAGGFEDEQIWMINNNIVYTDDGWETAKMAIGHFTDTNSGDCWGIVAPNIVGTLIAGENLVIESPKTNINGGPSATSLFKVDENGVSMYNSRIEMINPLNPDSNLNPQYGIILLDPDLGMGLGKYSGSYSSIHATTGDRIDGLIQDHNGTKKWNADDDSGAVTEEGRVNFWVDMDGDLHFKGTLHGADGIFSGSLVIGDPENKKGNGAKGVYLDSEGNLAIGGMYSPNDNDVTHTPKANFYVDNEGNLYAKSGTIEGDMYVNNLYFWDDDLDDWANVLDDHNKIKSKYIDLGNIILDGETGNVSIAGDIDLSRASSIDFGTFSPGMIYEYSVDGETNWHETKQVTDMYMRTVLLNPGSNGMTRTEGPAQQLELDWPAYIQATHIDMSQTSSPYIMGNDIYAIRFAITDQFTQTSGGSVSPGTPLGSIGQMNGYDGSVSTNGIGLRKDDNHYVICTSSGTRLQSGNVGSGGGGAVCTMANRTYLTQGNHVFVDVANASTESGATRPAGAAMYYGDSYFTPRSMVETTSSKVEIKYGHDASSVGATAITLDSSGIGISTDWAIGISSYHNLSIDSDGSVDLTSTGPMEIGTSSVLDISCDGFGLVSSGDAVINANGSYAIDLQLNGGSRFYTSASYIYMRINADNHCTIGSTEAILMWGGSGGSSVSCGSYGVRVSAGGWYEDYTSAGWTHESDRRLKTDIDYNIDGDVIDKLKPAQFRFKGREGLHYGFIAQEVKELIPEIVVEMKKVDEDDPYLGIAYTPIIPFLTAKVQKLTRQIEELERRISGGDK